MKRINALCYTKGHFGKGFREIVDTNNENLYSMGHYPTKIRKEDLPKDYIEFQSRVIWYMIGYLKTSGVVDVDYKAIKINHLFKDDYLYISYKEKLITKENKWGFYDYINYDICVCGGDIIPILFAIEKNSQVSTTKARNKIIDKFEWWKKHEEENYKRYFNGKEVTDIFKYYKSMYEKN